ncbi:hypothetical protein [Fulvivirga imtechensis]|nr:hypothetical protein [Fulvivirga imtechensis]
MFVESEEFKKTRQGQNPDQSFYGLIQPTGIMYGYPFFIADISEHNNWSAIDRIKVILADSFINIAELYNEKPITSEEEFWQLMHNTMDSVNHFYNGVYPELSTPTTSWLGQKKDVLTVTETLLEKRVKHTFKRAGNFWAEFFHHTQLFLDIYIFGQWSHTQPDKVLLEFFKEEKEELSYTAVKVMAAAAHANEHIESEEEKLFEHFIENSGLPAEKRRVANEYFEHGLAIQDIPIEETDPWVIRKFFLELAILTVWSDKKIEDVEWTFLSNFYLSLGFSEEDFDSSMIAVEGFVLQNWDQLDNLKERKDHLVIEKDYISRISKTANQFKNRIQKDIMEDKSLRDLLRKGSTTELNSDEKELIRSKFLLILKTIPTFRVISLPDDFLTFSLLLQVIPKEVINEVIRDG